MEKSEKEFLIKCDRIASKFGRLAAEEKNNEEMISFLRDNNTASYSTTIEKELRGEKMHDF